MLNFSDSQGGALNFTNVSKIDFDLIKVVKKITSNIINGKKIKGNIIEEIKPMSSKDEGKKIIHDYFDISKQADKYGNRIIFIILNACFEREDFETNYALKHLCLYGKKDIFNFFIDYFVHIDANLKDKINEILDDTTALNYFIHEGNPDKLLSFIKSEIKSGKTVDEIVDKKLYSTHPELFTHEIVDREGKSYLGEVVKSNGRLQK